MRKDVRLPFGLGKVRELLAEFGSPLYVYDEAGIQRAAKQLNDAFSWAPDYKNFFAVKATPTPGILKVLHEQGMGFDCSSRAELEIMRRMGVPGQDIFYTSNNTSKQDFELAIELNATVNIDDLSQVPVFIEALAGRSIECVAARYNPGDLKSGNAIIGEPTQAKYGMSLRALVETFNTLKEQGIKSFGLHTMVASNELNADYFADTAELLLDAMVQIEQETGVAFDFVNLGGGFGVNYRVDQPPLDVESVGRQIQAVFKRWGKDLRIFTENGRFVTGPHGYLLTKVQYVMRKHKTYLGVDASMHNLMRPGMYGAYHHVTILGKESAAHEHMYDIVGALCENNDKFAIDRELPEAKPGDVLVIHDAGAHGHAMGFNYNGLLKSAEVLLHHNGQATLIRRAETVDDYLKTIVWA